jgi:hypothetical protein
MDPNWTQVFALRIDPDLTPDPGQTAMLQQYRWRAKVKPCTRRNKMHRPVSPPTGAIVQVSRISVLTAALKKLFFALPVTVYVPCNALVPPSCQGHYCGTCCNLWSGDPSARRSAKSVDHASYRVALQAAEVQNKDDNPCSGNHPTIAADRSGVCVPYTVFSCPVAS